MSSRQFIHLAQAAIYLYLAIFARQVARNKFPKDPQKRESFRSSFPIIKNTSLVNVMALICVALFFWTLWQAFGRQLISNP